VEEGPSLIFIFTYNLYPIDGGEGALRFLSYRHICNEK